MAGGKNIHNSQLFSCEQKSIPWSIEQRHQWTPSLWTIHGESSHAESRQLDIGWREWSMAELEWKRFTLWNLDMCVDGHLPVVRTWSEPHVTGMWMRQGNLTIRGQQETWEILRRNGKQSAKHEQRQAVDHMATVTLGQTLQKTWKNRSWHVLTSETCAETQDDTPFDTGIFNLVEQQWEA